MARDSKTERAESLVTHRSLFESDDVRLRLMQSVRSEVI